MIVVCAILLLVTVIGFIGVQKTGNYENRYGFALIWGGVAFLISLVVAVIVAML